MFSILQESKLLIFHHINIFRQVTRSQEKNFEGIKEPFFPHYVYVTDGRKGWRSQKLRMHYLKEGNPDASEVSITILYAFYILLDTFT